MNTKGKAVSVCVGVAMLYGGMYGILYNYIGLLLSAVSDANEISLAAVSFFFPVFQLCSAIGIPFTTKLYFRKNNVFLLCGALLCTAAFFMMCCWTKTWQWVSQRSCVRLFCFEHPDYARNRYQ